MSSINAVVLKNDNEEIQRNLSAIKKMKKYDKLLKQRENRLFIEFSFLFKKRCENGKENEFFNLGRTT